MAKPTAEDYKLRFMLLREWKNKTYPSVVAAKINPPLISKLVFKNKIRRWYKYFNRGHTGIFVQHPHLNVFSLARSNETPKPLLDSIFLIDEKKQMWNEMVTKDGRFLFGHYFCEESKEHNIIMCDLFRGTRRKTQLPFKIPYHINFLFDVFGDRFLSVNGSSDRVICSAKVDYKNLVINEFIIVTIRYNISICFPVKLLFDQMDNKKFMIYDKRRITIGNIQQDGEIVTKNIGHDYGSYMYGERFINNVIQGFNLIWHDIMNSVTFYKLNLDTMEIDKTDVQIKLDSGDRWNLEDRRPFHYCWSSDHFYVFYQIETRPYKLLMFDAKILKWYDCKILAHNPKRLFVDENEIMTIQVNSNDNNVNATYRIALRKPDTLMNLTWLKAVRERNIYGDEKYINVMKNIQM